MDPIKPLKASKNLDPITPSLRQQYQHYGRPRVPSLSCGLKTQTDESLPVLHFPGPMQAPDPRQLQTPTGYPLLLLRDTSCSLREVRGREQQQSLERSRKNLNPRASSSQPPTPHATRGTQRLLPPREVYSGSNARHHIVRPQTRYVHGRSRRTQPIGAHARAAQCSQGTIEKRRMCLALRPRAPAIQGVRHLSVSVIRPYTETPFRECTVHPAPPLSHTCHANRRCSMIRPTEETARKLHAGQPRCLRATTTTVPLDQLQ